MSKQAQKSVVPSLWKTVSLDLNLHLDITTPNSHDNDVKYNRIITNTHHLTLKVGNLSDDELFRVCAELLTELRKAEHIKSLVFVTSQLDANCWTALEEMFTAPDSKIRRSISKIVFPHLNAHAIASHNEPWQNARKRAMATNSTTPDPGPFEEIVARCDGVMTFETSRNQGGDIAVSVQGSRHKAFFLPTHFDPIHADARKFDKPRQEGWGTSATAVGRILSAVGVNNPPTSAELHNRATASHLLQGVGRGVVTTDLPLTKLVLHQVDLNESTCAGVDLCSLRELELVSCRGHETLLDAFAPAGQKPALKLQKFITMNNQGNQLEWKKNVSGAFHRFLQAFDGLEVLHLHSSSRDKGEVNIENLLRNHATLKELSLRFGEEDLCAADIRKVASCCPNLKTLGLKWETANLLLTRGCLVAKFTNRLPELSQAIICLEKLQEIRIYARPVPNVIPFRREIDQTRCPYQRTAGKICEAFQKTFGWRPTGDTMGITKFELEYSKAWQKDDADKDQTVKKIFYFKRARYVFVNPNKS